MHKPTSLQFVEFVAFMHDYCLTNNRTPRFEECPKDMWSCWLWNDYSAGHSRWTKGFLLEAQIHRFLLDKGLDVAYMPELDVHRGVDLMVNCRPIQIKSAEPTYRKEGIEYLVVSGFYGILTNAHKLEILAQLTA